MVYNEKQIQKNITKNIKEYRKARNIKQKELADMVGVAASTASSWEQGACVPSIDTLVKICAILKVDINEMFGIDAVDPSLNLSEMEKKLVLAYRKADDMDKKIIERTAGITTVKREKNIV